MAPNSSCFCCRLSCPAHPSMRQSSSNNLASLASTTQHSLSLHTPQETRNNSHTGIFALPQSPHVVLEASHTLFGSPHPRRNTAFSCYLPYPPNYTRPSTEN